MEKLSIENSSKRMLIREEELLLVSPLMVHVP